MLFESVNLLAHAVQQLVSRLGIAVEEKEDVLSRSDFLLQVFVHTHEFLTVGHGIHTLGEIGFRGSALLLKRFPCSTIGIPLGIEERIASVAELFPKVIGVLAGNGTDFLPLLLQGDERVCGLFPFGAVFQLLCAREQVAFLAQVVVEEVFHLLVESTFGFEERLTERAVFLVDRLVALLGRKTDGAPFRLYSLNSLRGILPLFARFETGDVYLFEAFNKRLLLGKVLLFLCMELVEIRLMLLVDDGGSGFETVPEVFAEFACNGTYLRPLVVELLQGAACLDH